MKSIYTISIVYYVDVFLYRMRYLTCAPPCFVLFFSFVFSGPNFFRQLVGALGRGKKVYVVCCEPGARAALGTVAGTDVRDLNAKNLPPVKAGDVQIVVTPVGF